MKLLVAIIQDEDASAAVDALTKAGLRITQLSTAGGFLRRGNATLLVGVDSARTAEVRRILVGACRARTEYYTPSAVDAISGPMFAQPVAVQVGGATIFELDVRDFVRM